jgi:hypothetical protein
MPAAPPKLPSIRIGVVVRSAAPKHVFVDLQMLLRNTAEEHGPEPPVTKRQGVRPLLRRSVIAQAELLGG